MESKQVGMLVLVAAALIVAMVLFPALANQAAVATTTQTFTNQAITSAAVNSSIQLTGQNFQGTPVITNGSSIDVTAQFTISATGGVITMKTLDAAAIGRNNATLLNATYISEPIGYADATTRSIVPLILIFFALAIVAIALWPVIRNLRESM
jgi:hypothetical protein